MNLKISIFSCIYLNNKFHDRIKVESQLSSLIMKFDSEVTARQESFDELVEEFKTLEQERTQLMVNSIIINIFFSSY